LSTEPGSLSLSLCLSLFVPNCLSTL
jgi:hypothetical protein